METQQLKDFVLDKLEDAKSRDIVTLDVTGKSSITDMMLVCSGNSKRHVNSIAEKLVEATKHANHAPLSIEGQDTGEWVLVDLGDIIVHVMQDETRDFYQLEKLWG
ncbi:ribosome silencing factor [Lacimicrobium alkaliphilum]|uniref:Ribosomal silencing factor RsfS n=1 Tax=Lacimicrobium alkaliphilum TaxID=1526571 RepID=A0A0U2ZHS6_9ALTE|nr:ribosome silencing factor [Lacimicrobium alkaliphilum]ALS97932.1 ribosome silencing factor [Lacimicrobium alkaliphilum]